MDSYRYEDRPHKVFFRELTIIDEEKSTPWKTIPPARRNSSTKSGRNTIQIKKDRKRKKMKKRK